MDSIPIKGTSAIAHPVDTTSIDEKSFTTQDVVPIFLVEERVELPSTIVAPIVQVYTIFGRKEKVAIVAIVSLAGVFAPLSANIYFPAIPSIAADFSVSVDYINLTVSLYMLSQGIAPMVWGPTSDLLGRRPVYLLSFLIFIGSAFGQALTSVYGVLAVLRVTMAFGAASVATVGSGTISDISPPRERPSYMLLYSIGPLVAPILGPGIGGAFVQVYDWRAIFFFLGTFGGLVYVLILVILPETLRSIVGNGSIPAAGYNKTLLASIIQRKHRDDPVGPHIVVAVIPKKKTWKEVDFLSSYKLFAQKDVLLLLIFKSMMHMLYYAVLTSTAYLFGSNYTLTDLQVGVCFASLGLGSLVAVFANGWRLNRDYRIVLEESDKALAMRTEADTGEEEKGVVDENDISHFPIERARLRTLPAFSIIFIVATITYGWTIQKQVHIAVPLISQFFIGFCGTTQFKTISTLLVDLYPTRSASVSASSNLSKCIMGAVGSAIVGPIVLHLGAGWGFTFLALASAATSPCMVMEWKYGVNYRAKRAEREKIESKLKEEEKNLRLAEEKESKLEAA